MKRLFPLAILITMALILSSCSNDSLLRRFDSFVSSIEDECYDNSYVEEFWMNADKKFKKLYDEYQSNRSSFNSDEKRELNSDIARYEFQRISSFVSYVEEEGPEFSEDDWLSANERFMELAREYKQNRHSYNSSEKRQIDSVILHYCGIVIRSKIPGVTSKIRSILKELGLSI